MQLVPGNEGMRAWEPPGREPNPGFVGRSASAASVLCFRNKDHLGEWLGLVAGNGFGRHVSSPEVT